MEAVDGHGARVELLVSFPKRERKDVGLCTGGDTVRHDLSALRRLILIDVFTASRLPISVEITTFNVGMDFGQTGGFRKRA
jgi:hypothetical protein